jgi:hypothetical protein
MANITSANAAQAIPKLVAVEILEALMSNFVMGALVNRNYENTLAAKGDTVNVPVPPILTANNIAETGTVQTQNPSMGNAQVVLDSHIESTFGISDVAKALAAPDLIQGYIKPAVIAISERVELDLLSQYPLFTFNTAVGGSSALTESVVDSAETALFNAKVPDSEAKFLVLSGNAYGQARQLPRFSEYQTVGPQVQPSPILSGQVPAKLKGFTVYRSQLVPKPSSTTFNIAFAKDALALVVRPLPLPMAGTGAIGAYETLGNFGVRVVMSYQPNSLGQQFTVDCLYGVGVLRQSFGVQVQTN